jgi:hypothetical protein
MSPPPGDPMRLVRGPELGSGPQPFKVSKPGDSPRTGTVP